MKVWTAHLRRDEAPALVREGFSWAAAIFGPFFLLAHRAWIAAVLVLCADIALDLAFRGATRSVLLLASAWLMGIFGNDLRRWSLARAGYAEGPVVVAPDADSALLRLVGAGP